MFPRFNWENPMSPEERQLLTGLFDRVRGAAANPRDREAEMLIDDAVRAQPYAPYLLAQTVLVQEQALRAANDRLQQLEAQVRDLQQQASQQPSSGGGFLSGLGSLFGGGNPPRPSTPPSGSPWNQSQGYNAPPPPSSPWGQQQQYASPPPSGGPWGGQPQGGGWGGQPQGGMFSGQPQQGGGFLKGALGAAAGVAGGVLLADSIRNLMGGHNNTLGIGNGFGDLGNALPNSGLGGGETIVNNYYNDDAASVREQNALQDANQDQDDDQDAADDYSDDDFTTDV
jgi:hypothetical protein